MRILHFGRKSYNMSEVETKYDVMNFKEEHNGLNKFLILKKFL